jgi:hypothetical protein
MIFRPVAALLFFGLLPAVLTAKEPLDGKFTLRGERLIYDTETNVPDGEDDITTDDADRFLEILQANPGLKVLELNSGGGSLWAGQEMARIAIDFGIDTIVSGECFSSCVTLFLAGNSRRMMLGSKIGFHQTSWSAASTQKYYEKWRAEENWETPFDFASWVYEDTQTEVFEDLTYMIERGVDPAFAVRTKGVRNDDEWYPSRLELMQAGVLRD